MKPGLMRHFLLLLFVLALPNASYGQTSADRIVGSAQGLTASATTVALKSGAFRELAIARQLPAAKVLLKAVADPVHPAFIHKFVVADAGDLPISEANTQSPNLLAAHGVLVARSAYAYGIDRAGNGTILNDFVPHMASFTFDASVRLACIPMAQLANNIDSACGMIERCDVFRRQKVTIDRLEQRSRESCPAQVQSELSETDQGCVHALHKVNAAQRVSRQRT